MNALEKIQNGIDKILNKQQEVQALRIALDSGVFLDISSQDGLIKVGDMALIEGASAEDGDYLGAEEKVTYRVEGGKIAAIEKPEMVEAALVGEFVLNAVEKVNTSFAKQFEAMKAQFSEVSSRLEKVSEKLNASQEQVTALQSELTEVKAGKTSTYTAPNGDNSDGEPEKEAVNIYAKVWESKAEIRNRK